MTDEDSSPRDTALQELEAALDQHRRDQDPARRESDRAPGKARFWRFRKPGWRLPFNLWFPFDRRHPVVRSLTIAVLVISAVVAAGGGVLWWRLRSGPIELDVATPWLTAAIEQNFGSGYQVKVGGTQLERDAQGHTRIRLRDIVVRDAAGALVANAPKAEVGLSGTSLLMARPRAESFRLVDAAVVIHIEPNGRIDVFAGGERPFATIMTGDARPPAPPRPSNFSLQAMAERSVATNVAAVLAWIDGLGGLGRDGAGRDGRTLQVTGFDGQNLTEVGITNGSLTIDDRRDGQEWSFRQISIALNRPSSGGAVLSVMSEDAEQPWMLNTALIPHRGGRHLQIDARRVPLDNLFALRMIEGKLRSDTLVSAAIEAEIGPDGVPQALGGTVVAEGGTIGDLGDPEHSLPIGRAEFALDWDSERRTLRMPFKIVSGATRITLRSEFAAPTEAGGKWLFAIGGGWVVLDPLTPDDDGLVLRRVVVRGNIDAAKQRLTLEQADFGTKEVGGKDPKDLSIALSGSVDLGAEPRLAIGLAGNQMSVATLKRVWPVFVAPKVREWIVQHVASGTVERIDVAANAALAALQASGPPLPDEGLSIDIVASGATLRPVDGLPPIREADLKAKITGRTAVVTLQKGSVDVSPGRKLTISNGTFEVADTHPKAPPARVRFRLDGAAPAAAELLALDRLREFSGAPFDPATTRGMLTAQVDLTIPLQRDLPKGSTQYDIGVDLTNFSADRMLLGQKVEAAALHVSANNQRYEIKGDVKINGTAAQIEYRKATTDPDAELRLQASLDEASRVRVGLDFGTALAGTLPVKLAGWVGTDDRPSRFNVEADLTSVKIDNLLPGWVKPAGKSAKAAFTLVRDQGAIRFDDLLIDGPGVLAKGTLELDANGEVQSANFPVFATSDGDKATLKADRTSDGALRVTMRGDVYDGRNFIKSALASPPLDPKAKSHHSDLDLDIKLGVVAGFYAEPVRGLDLRLSRRGGRIRSFTLNAKIGRDTPLIGELRNRVANGKPVLYFETNDAGALFRFTDIYPRMIGGKMWMGMDPPTQDQSPQDGLINVSDFAIRDEGTLDRMVSNAPSNRRNVNVVEFSQARADFTKLPGRMTVREGVVRGPLIGGTIEGQIDYVRDEVNMRGTLVPLYGLNNMFGQIPIVGLFLGGGSKEGMFGLTYEVTGPTSNPRPSINPISAIAPGVLRKFFEFRDVGDRNHTFGDPPR